MPPLNVQTPQVQVPPPIQTPLQPVPTPQMVATVTSFAESAIKSTAKDFFIYLAMFVLTLTSICDVFSILFRLTDHAFPEKVSSNGVASLLSGYSSFFGGFPTAAVSSLTFAFPTLGVLAFIVLRSVNREPERGHLFVRLLAQSATAYVMLFSVLGSLTSLLYYFIEDDLSTAFIIKTLSVFAVGLCIGFYYLYALRHDYHLTTYIPYVFYGVSALVVVGLVMASIITFDRPVSPRKVAEDSAMSRNLQLISTSIESYAKKNNSLPSSLNDLTSQQTSSYMYTVDKDSLSKVTYTVTSPITTQDFTMSGEYTLCATFNASSSTSFGSSYNYYSSYSTSNSPNYYLHSKGNVCYTSPVTIAINPYQSSYQSSSVYASSSAYGSDFFRQYLSASGTYQR